MQYHHLTHIFEFNYSVTDKTGNLGEVLQTMFLAYSDSFLKQAQISKELIEAKAFAVEEVTLLLYLFLFLFFLLFLFSILFSVLFSIQVRNWERVQIYLKYCFCYCYHLIYLHYTLLHIIFISHIYLSPYLFIHLFYCFFFTLPDKLSSWLISFVDIQEVTPWTRGNSHRVYLHILYLSWCIHHHS